MRVYKGERWIKNTLSQIRSISTQTSERSKSWLSRNKINLIKGVGLTIGAVGLFGTIVWLGNHYVKVNTNEVFHVYVENEEAGVVSDPGVVEKFVLTKVKKLEMDFPNARMLLNADDITYEPERAFMHETDDDTIHDKLDGLLIAKAIGVEIRVDGELIGIVKDQETADSILGQVQEKYIPQKQVKGQVAILSFEEEEPQPPLGQSQLEEVTFVEEVSTALIETNPETISVPEDILQMLEIGDTQPSKYVVLKGDCVNCIAEKFSISPQIIYNNNNLTEDSILGIGDVLDLIVEKPALSVKTLERHQEMIAVHYDTIVEYDNKVKAGNNTVTRPGVEGKKLVTYLTTKLNGHWENDEVIDEDIVEEPISAIIRKGTMIIKGEGTGSFANPVKNAKVSSSYGMRWGRLHAGTDSTSKSRDIFASDNGVVTIAGSHNSYGNYVVIDHKNGFKTLYAHLSKISITKGKVVEKGDKIGVMGTTGNSTGIHLHFEIQKNGKAVNPASYLK